MSSPEFANYDIISNQYDITRIPIGVGIIRNLLNQNQDQVLLDAGCGTGNYIAALAPSVKKIIGLEFNSGMLKQAQSKFKNSEKVELVQGSLLEKLPFEDNTFHGILINQVLHHLDTDWENFPNAEKLFNEFYRVLKPGGFLAINTCHRGQREALWWANLMPRVRDDYINRYMTLDKMGKTFNQIGFVKTQAVAIKEPLQGISYFNLMGPFAPYWRSGDSRWSLVTDTELAEIQQTLLDKANKSELGKFFDQFDQIRQKEGLTTEVVTFKPNPELAEKVAIQTEEEIQ